MEKEQILAKIRASDKPVQYWLDLIAVSDLSVSLKDEIKSEISRKEFTPQVVHNTPNLWQNTSGVSH